MNVNLTDLAPQSLPGVTSQHLLAHVARCGQPVGCLQEQVLFVLPLPPHAPYGGHPGRGVPCRGVLCWLHLPTAITQLIPWTDNCTVFMTSLQSYLSSVSAKCCVGPFSFSAFGDCVGIISKEYHSNQPTISLSFFNQA